MIALKKVLSAVLTAALLVSTVPAAFAASDIDGHWAKSYITELHENGIINPSASTGNYGPDDKVTRWECMRYINRAFGFTEKADISYSDVNSSDVFYETVQIAVKQGYINGVGNNRMAPEGTLTREQAAKRKILDETGKLRVLAQTLTDVDEAGGVRMLLVLAESAEEMHVDGAYLVGFDADGKRLETAVDMSVSPALLAGGKSLLRAGIQQGALGGAEAKLRTSAPTSRWWISEQRP